MMKKIQNKFNLDNDLPLKKTLELYDIVIDVWSIFHEGQQILSTSVFRWMFGQKVAKEQKKNLTVQKKKKKKKEKQRRRILMLII